MNDHSKTVWIVSLLLLLGLWCWLDIWPRGTLNPARVDLHRTDFTVYVTAGKAALAGENPYAVTNARGWGYLYLPLLALLVSPLAQLPEGWQCVIWFWISVACLWGAWREFSGLDAWFFPKASADSPHATYASTSPSGLWTLFGFAWPVLNCLQRGQVGVLQLYLTLLGVRLVCMQRNWLPRFFGGTALAAAVVLKLSPALPTAALLVGLFITHNRRLATLLKQNSFAPFCGVAMGLVIGIWLLPAMIVGWEANQTFLATWRQDILPKANSLTSDPFAGDSHSSKNQSPMNATWLLGNVIAEHGAANSGEHVMDGHIGQTMIGLVRIIAVALAGASIALLLWQSEEGGLLMAVVLANAATLLVVPIARGHYFMALFPAAVWLPEWLARQMVKSGPVSRGIAILKWLPPTLLVFHYLTGGIFANWGVLGLGSLAWLMLAAVAILEVSISPPRSISH
jgi:hypothetical protein